MNEKEKFFVFNEYYGDIEVIQWFETLENAKKEAKRRKKLRLREDEQIYVGELKQ